MSNIGYQAFEAIANLVKPGQSLDTYCDSEVRHQINVNLAIAKLADPHFAVDSKSEITDIIHAMKNFYNKGLQLKKASKIIRGHLPIRAQQGSGEDFDREGLRQHGVEQKPGNSDDASRRRKTIRRRDSRYHQKAN